MDSIESGTSWVVYLMTVHNKQTQMNAVCEQGEWDAMELARPGYHTLVRAGITSEGEAERLARGTSGDKNRSAQDRRKRTFSTAGGDEAPGLPVRQTADAERKYPG
jgi:hypothetical protein